MRCSGFLDSTERYAHCTNDGHAGALRLDERTEPPSYLHRLNGPCDCGVAHVAGPAAVVEALRSAPSPALPAASAEYVYCDAADRRALYKVTRHQLGGADKTFRQWTPDGRGGWRGGLHGQEPTLYRLPELVEALAVDPRRWVFVVEGEKDVERLRSLGLVATCNTGGAGKWPQHASQHLAGARVVVIPDNDADGWSKHLPVVAAALRPVVSKLRVLALPWVKDKGDVSDWLDAGGDVEQLKQLALQALEYGQHRQPSQLSSNGHAQAKPGDDPLGFVLVTLGQLVAEPAEAVDWIVDGLIPCGGVILLSAKPKVGKTTLARTLVTAVARGLPFLGRKTLQGSAIYLALEESRPRLRERFAKMGVRDDDQVWIHVGKAPQDALLALLAAITSHHPSLVVIDPLFRFTRVKDVSAYAEVTAALENIVEAARKTGCAIVVVHHDRKAMGDGGDQILGSTAIFGAVDTAILMQKRSDGVRLVETEQRYGEPVAPTVVSLDERGCAVLGVSLGDYERAATIRRILDTLKDGPRTQGDLREALQMQGQKLSQVLSQLVAGGQLECTGEGKRGKPYLYSLPPGPLPEWVANMGAAG